MDQLVEYIRNYLKQGYAPSQIQQALLSSGYPPQMIQQAFNQARMQNTYAQFPERHEKPVAHPHEQEDKTHVNKKLFIIIGVILILIVGAVFVFSDSSSSTLPSTTTTTTTTSSTTTTMGSNVPSNATVEIFEARYCNDIDKYINCFENRYNEYKLGEPIYLYFKIFIDSHLKNGKYVIGFTQDREVYDPNGNRIDELTRTNILDVTREVPETGTFSMPAYNKIPTDETMQKGEYTIKTLITDKYTNSQIEFTTKFTLIS